MLWTEYAPLRIMGYLGQTVEERMHDYAGEAGEASCAGLSPRPVAEDWLRWATEVPRPGRLIGCLQVTGQLREYPELAALIGVPQDPEWHPEGPVDVHVAHVLDAAADIALREGLAGDERALLLFAALTHDLGKATTTRLRDRGGRVRWTSYGHEQEGVPVTEGFLRRIGIPEEIVIRVSPLVARHMEFHAFTGRETGARAIRRLAARLAPATIRQLVYLIEADHSGRPPLPAHLPDRARHMRELAARFGVLDGPPALTPGDEPASACDSASQVE